MSQRTESGEYLTLRVVGALAVAAAMLQAARRQAGSRSVLGSDHLSQGQRERQRRIDGAVRANGYQPALTSLLELEQGVKGREQVGKLAADHRYLVRTHGKRQGSRSLSPFAESLIDLLAALRSIHWDEWTGHWTTRGPTFYGDHLLMEKLYSDELPEQIDSLAERIVAAYGPDAVDSVKVMGRASMMIGRWSRIECPLRRALAAEKELQQRIVAAYEAGKASGTMSLGMDDELMGLANAHETALYLLGQRLGTEHVCGACQRQGKR